MFGTTYINKDLLTYAIVFLLILCNNISYGQKVRKIAQDDSVHVPQGYVLVLRDTFYIPENDSTIHIKEGTTFNLRKSPYFRSEKFYDSLQSKASKTKLTRSLYGLLFTSSSQNITDKKNIVNAEAPFIPFEGKTYGKIIIKRVPILDGSVRDTTKQVRTWYAKLFNNAHVATRKSIIRENLFIVEGEKVDPYQLADNERVLRQFRTIRDAKIYLSPNTENPDVVDVIVVTQDLVSLGGALSYTSPTDFSIDLYERNILGYARDFQVTYAFDESSFTDKKHGYGLRYRVPNLWGTFLRGTVFYDNFSFREEFGGNLSRDFFTPEIKYGGGASLSVKSSFFEPLAVPNTRIPYDQNNFSIWVGRSFQLERRTNFILQSAYELNNFTERPYTSETLNRFFINNNQVLVSASLLNRTYSKSKLIKGFGRTEDISKGFLLSLTYGFDALEFYNRNYWEFKNSFADYIKSIGYIYFANSIGAFKHSDPNNWEDGVFRSELKYFSPLIKEKRANFRQFITFEYSRGINNRSQNYLLVDNSYTGDSPVRPLGNQRFSLDFESVFFTPWYFYGCKFAFYNRYRANWLADDNLLSSSNFYTAYSLGFRVLNESLVFPTIEVSFSFLDGPPQYVNDYQFRIFNNYSNTFQDLSIGRPAVIRYQN